MSLLPSPVDVTRIDTTRTCSGETSPPTPAATFLRTHASSSRGSSARTLADENAIVASIGRAACSLRCAASTVVVPTDVAPAHTSVPGWQTPGDSWAQHTPSAPLQGPDVPGQQPLHPSQLPLLQVANSFVASQAWPPFAAGARMARLRERSPSPQASLHWDQPDQLDMMQSMAHTPSRSSCDSAGHRSPPSDAGVSITTTRVCTGDVVVHSVHSLHEKTQSTGSPQSCSLQVSASSKSGQAAPPSLAGTDTLLRRLCVPPPQSAEH
mmetsp:Transcript_47928/g.115237  ORF Transcript_47928/g.115237 Transcript_47928/m.115237 type:complete len:267 (-) Transcript_47928:1431-2231(-)